ncbi:MAG: restriction endonuclease subunit S [Cyanobacteria bacterium]|nr:restriction endonuclease subunit S [Cyanobacteriota bacterium]
MISRNFFTDIYPIKFLGEVVEFLDSKRRPVTESDRRAGNYPYYGANGQQGTIDDYIFDEPLVLLAEDGGHFGNPERGIAYQISGKTWVNNHAHVLRPKENIDLAFLCRVLENYDVTPFVTGTTRGKLTQAGAAGIPIPIPPIAEQKRIAEILDRTQSLISKRKEAIAKLDTLTQSIFLEMFGDPDLNPKEWEVTEFSSQIKSVRYGTGSPPIYSEEGIPFIRATNVKEGTVKSKDMKRISLEEANKIAKCQIKFGDLIVVRSGVNTGDCAMISREYDGAYAAFDLIVELPLTNAIFYNFLINSAYGKSYLAPLTRRAAQPHLNAEQLKNLRFISPSMSLKEEFAKRVEAVEKIKETHRASLSELQALFASLQHRAFRGEL